MKKLNKLFLSEIKGHAIGVDIAEEGADKSVYRLSFGEPFHPGVKHVIIDKETADQIRATQSLELLDLN